MLNDVHKSSCHDILCDESTDIANLKQLVIFVKYLVSGLRNTRFLKVVSLVDSKAHTIEQKLVEVCQTCQVSLTQVVIGLGSDDGKIL